MYQPTKVRSTSPLTSSSGLGGGKSGLGSSQKIPGSNSGGLKSSSSSGLLSSGGLSSKAGGSSKSFPSSSSAGGSLKQGSLGAELGRARDKARFKSSDKSFASKASDLRNKSSPSTAAGGTMESEGEKAFKLLAAHASSMGGLPSLPGLPAQLVVEGLMKQLDTNFQIPKLSARVNADNSGDKRSVDKVDSGSKSDPNSSRSSQVLPGPNITSSKPDEAHSHSSSNSLVGGYSSTSASASAVASGSSAVNAHDSDLPTNLSMQVDDASLSMKPELSSSSSSRSYLNTGDSSTSHGMGGDGGNMESLNLVTKGADKYKSGDDKDQHQSFHRVSHSDKKMVS